jgi:Na+/H+ antiporter NhaD/arsenite permease-like protein
MSSLTLALLIFGLCYALIMTERLHKTIVALFGVVSQEEAFYSHEFGVDYSIVIVDIARKAGYRIAFWQFFKFGFPVMVSSVALSALYLWLVFLR